MSIVNGIVRYDYDVDRDRYPWPTFSPREFERRYELVRGFMAERDLDCLLVSGNCSLWERSWANVRWLSNYIGTMELDSYVIFPYHGDPTLAILGLNARLPDRIARSVIPDVRGAFNTAAILIERITELGLQAGRIGIIRPAPWLSIPADQFQALREAFPRAVFSEYSDEFWRLRLVLSGEELACLTEAARIGDCAVRAVVGGLARGMTERDMFRLIFDSITAEGGEIPAMMLAASESMHDPGSGFQRPRPIDRTIADGDVLLMELGARDAHGYEAQTGKAVVYGTPPADYEDMLEVMFLAYGQVTKALRPGCTARDLREAGHVIIDRGYQVVAPLVHGVFNPIDAGPFVGTSHRPDKDVVLQPGMACCVEIHPCTADVRRGVFMGDTYVITEDGARNLNAIPPELIQL
jgi:Xaa-Pro dipeptidase